MLCFCPCRLWEVGILRNTRCSVCCVLQPSRCARCACTSTWGTWVSVHRALISSAWLYAASARPASSGTPSPTRHVLTFRQLHRGMSETREGQEPHRRATETSIHCRTSRSASIRDLRRLLNSMAKWWCQCISSLPLCGLGRFIMLPWSKCTTFLSNVHLVLLA